ncbi:hypothetical protein [Virgisporangium aurantiacum]|uniref:Uncharacterized protein n=1 Tax=Virgisporangium aurantiacum TaxID=175570 RepID=A0A8J3Z8D3_9ACTN|nr:hypothetical protein [Virgisporangium aurantiacum]GIJ58937.1 hypothetical protein Vau01_064530 [Virgisporangium aurantiacum]
MSGPDSEFEKWLHDANADITDSVQRAQSAPAFQNWVVDADRSINESLRRVTDPEAVLLMIRKAAYSKAADLVQRDGNSDAEHAIRSLLAPQTAAEDAEDERPCSPANRKAAPNPTTRSRDNSYGMNSSSPASRHVKHRFDRWGFIIGNVLIAFGAPVFVTSLIASVASHRTGMEVHQADIAAVVVGAAFMSAGTALIVLAGWIWPERSARLPSRLQGTTRVRSGTGNSSGEVAALLADMPAVSPLLEVAESANTDGLRPRPRNSRWSSDRDSSNRPVQMQRASRESRYGG